jgi:hypothetical protein
MQPVALNKPLKCRIGYNHDDDDVNDGLTETQQNIQHMQIQDE